MDKDHSDQDNILDDINYKQLAESSLTGIFVHREGKILYTNNRILEISGYTREEFMKKSVFEHIHPDDAPEVIDRMKRRTAGEDNVESSYEIRCFSKNGELFWVRLNAVVIEYEGEPAILCNAIDVTELINLKKERLLLERLTTAGKVVERIGHEFSNFLTPILGYTDLLAEKLKGKIDTKVSSYLEAMSVCADRLTRINSDFLALGRRLHFNLEPVNVNNILTSVVEESHENWSNYHEIHQEFSDDLLLVMADRLQLTRVFSNVISNSFEAIDETGSITVKTAKKKFTRDKKISEITGSTIPSGDYVVVTIKDTGCGIPDGIKDTIFDAFFSTKKQDERRGPGLGLFVVKNIISDHGGYMDLHSAAGVGTTFDFYFPAAPLQQK